MSEPAQPQSLRELVLLARERQGVDSDVALHQRAEAAGYELTNATIGKLRRGIYPARPKRHTLEALAELAEVSFDVAARAAGMAARPGRPYAEELPPDVDILDGRRREVLREVTVELIRAQRMEDRLADSWRDGEPEFSYLTDADRAAPDLLDSSDQTGDSSIG